MTFALRCVEKQNRTPHPAPIRGRACKACRFSLSSGLDFAFNFRIQFSHSIFVDAQVPCDLQSLDPPRRRRPVSARIFLAPDAC
jgi:hypothetical protein